MAINKIPVNWSPNPSAETNLITYDKSTQTYDSSTQTYDSIVIGDVNDTEKLPVQWSNV